MSDFSCPSFLTTQTETHCSSRYSPTPSGRPPPLKAVAESGARCGEARYLQRAELTAKCADSLRELEESAYWLELLVDGENLLAAKLQLLRAE